MAAPIAGLFVVGLGASLAVMDLAVNVAFPSISEAFALETPEIRWVVICYVLTYSILMLVFGRLGDRIGHRRVFRAGLAVCAVAFALCGLATDYASLLMARVVQGVGTALVLSCAPALSTLLFDETQRTNALGGYSSLTALATLAAPLVGGASIAILGWSGVFWFRLPVALLALVLLPLLPHQDRAPSSRADRVPRAVLRDPAFVLPNVAGIAVYFVAFAVPLLVPYYLTWVAGYTALGSGAVIALSPAGTLLGSALAPKMVRALGVRRTALLGGALLAAGSLSIASWPSMPWLGVILATLALNGAGVGLFQVAYTDIVLAALPRGARGVAGSLTMVMRTIGVMSAATALTALLHAIESRQRASGVAETAAFADAFGTVFLCAGLAIAVFFAVSGLHRERR